MSIEEKYKRRNVDVQQHVRSEIKKGISEKNLVQLNGILEELEKMMDNKCLPLSYPRIIVDSWEYHDKLGMELLDLVELYKHWK